MNIVNMGSSAEVWYFEVKLGGPRAGEVARQLPPGRRGPKILVAALVVAPSSSSGGGSGGGGGGGGGVGASLDDDGRSGT